MQFLAELQRRVSVLPGVASVAVTDALPLSGGHRSDSFELVGRKPNGEDPNVELFMATPGYFDTLGIHLTSGHDFSNESATSSRVAVINQALSEKLFSNENPIGQSVTGGGLTYEVIGVTNNIKARFLGEAPKPVLFRSLPQTISADPSFEGYTLLVAVSPQQTKHVIPNEVREVRNLSSSPLRVLSAPNSAPSALDPFLPQKIKRVVILRSAFRDEGSQPPRLGTQTTDFSSGTGTPACVPGSCSGRTLDRPGAPPSPSEGGSWVSLLLKGSEQLSHTPPLRVVLGFLHSLGARSFSSDNNNQENRASAPEESDSTTSSLAPSVRAVSRELDPTLAVFNEQTMEHHLREAFFLPRLAGTLFAVFGTVGLLLAAIGL